MYIDRTSWNCNITGLIHITCTISLAIARDCWTPRQENFLPSAAFLFNEDSENVENTCNLAIPGKNWKEFNFFQAHKIDLWNRTRTVIEIVGNGILMKEFEQNEVWVEIKLLIEIKLTGKNYISAVLLKLDDFTREI